MRIVSLLPSATEIICSLGLVEQLVGVTHECDWPPGVESKFKVTRTLIPTDASSREIDRLVTQQQSVRSALYTLDFERMQELAPNLIVSQTLCDVCAVDDAEVRRFVQQFDGRGELGNQPRVVYLEPTCFDDVLDNIREVAVAAGVAEPGAKVIASLRERIESVRGSSPDAASGQPGVRVSTRPKVVVLEWLDPLFSSGHWTPELVEIAGGVEPIARRGERSRRITMDELAAADPDLILIACCGFSVERTMQDVPAFLALPQIARLRCAAAGDVFVIDGSAYFSRPGPRLVDSVEILANAIDAERHPLAEGMFPARRVETMRSSDES